MSSILSWRYQYYHQIDSSAIETAEPRDIGTKACTWFLPICRSLSLCFLLLSFYSIGDWVLPFSSHPILGELIWFYLTSSSSSIKENLLESELEVIYSTVLSLTSSLVSWHQMNLLEILIFTSSKTRWVDPFTLTSLLCIDIWLPTRYIWLSLHYVNRIGCMLTTTDTDYRWQAQWRQCTTTSRALR